VPCPRGGHSRTLARGEASRLGASVHRYGNANLKNLSQFSPKTLSRASVGTTEPTVCRSATVSISSGLSSRPNHPSRSEPIPTHAHPPISAMWLMCRRTAASTVTGIERSVSQDRSRNPL
jgi:hypothetical protein